jgi:predicted O-methyltransferase YrrM
MKNKKLAGLLFSLAADVKDGCIVELGTYLGYGAITLARGAASGYGAKVYTIDDYKDRGGCLGGIYKPSDKKEFEQNVAKAGVDVTLIHESHYDAAQEWNKPIGFLRWDSGDKENIERDWENWSRHIVPGGVVELGDTVKGDLGTIELIEKIVADGVFEIESFEGGVTVLRRIK